MIGARRASSLVEANLLSLADRHSLWTTAAILGAGVLGTMVAFAGTIGVSLMLIGIAAGLPLTVWLVLRHPAAGCGILVYSLVFEPFEFATPLGNITIGIAVLVVFAFVRMREIGLELSHPGRRWAVICAVLFVAGHAVQFVHVDAAQAARGMITAASLAAYFLLGIYLGAQIRYFHAAGMGAVAGLVTLGAVSLAWNLGLALVPHDATMSREILGITSPFLRSYGFGFAVPVGLFLSLAVPALVYGLGPSWPASVRLSSAFLFAILLVIALLLFQSRSMVLEIPVGVAIAFVLRGRSFASAAALTLVVGILAFGLASSLVTTSDNSSVVSDQLRAESYLGAISFLLRNPAVLLIGENPTYFHAGINSTLTYGAQISANAPTHNLLVETVIAGGITSALALVAIAMFPYLKLSRRAIGAHGFGTREALAVAASVIGLVEASITPATTNSAPLWLVLGWVVAVSTGPPIEGPDAKSVSKRAPSPGSLAQVGRYGASRAGRQ